MFLKVFWENKIKKVSFSPELRNLDNFKALLSRITDTPVSSLVITFVDEERETLKIGDELDFEYFLNIPFDGKYKNVFVGDGCSQNQSGMTIETQAPPAKVEQVPTESRLQPINVNARPFRALATYRGLDEFVNYFDEQLTFQPVEKPAPKEVHCNVTCDNCQAKDITGKRFKCLVCNNFDICETCESKDAHNQHPMIRCSIKEDTYVLAKLGRKYLRYKHKQERRQRIGKQVRESIKALKHGGFHQVVEHAVQPLLQKTGHFLSKIAQKIDNQVSTEKLKVDPCSAEQKPQAKVTIPAQSAIVDERLETQEKDKKDLLRFMYPEAEQAVIDELVRRFEGVGLVDFFSEIERCNQILDGNN